MCMPATCALPRISARAGSLSPSLSLALHPLISFAHSIESGVRRLPLSAISCLAILAATSCPSTPSLIKHHTPHTHAHTLSPSFYSLIDVCVWFKFTKNCEVAGFHFNIIMSVAPSLSVGVCNLFCGLNSLPIRTNTLVMVPPFDAIALLCLITARFTVGNSV